MLAQSGTVDSDNLPAFSGQFVQGTGTEFDNRAAWKRRAKRKMITLKMILSLISVAEKKGDKERVRAYWNCFHCQDKLYSSEGRVYGKYCKNRFCTLCSSIRKAEIINKYLPVVRTWPEPYFVTLTIKAVPAEKLSWALRGIHRAFLLIRGKYNKRSQRGTGEKLMGIKSLECNYNPVRGSYNPHLHLVVSDRETAVKLVVQWQRYWNKKGIKYTSPAGQHKRKVQDIERDLVEVIKYGAKIFTEPDMDKKAKNKIPPVIYAAALDNIFSALKPYRLFDRFGFNLPASEKPDKATTLYLHEYAEWIYHSERHDWINEDTGELMTGYVPPPMLQFLISQNIDTQLE